MVNYSVSERIFWLWSLIAMVAVLQGCQPEDPEPNIDIETREIDEIGPTRCTIKGEILEIGLNGIDQHGFVWSESPDPDLESGNFNQMGMASGPGTFSYTLRDLVPNTTYYVKAYASGAGQVAYGTEKTFATTDPTVPDLHTLSAFDIRSYSARTGGEIYSDGGAVVTKRGVCWDTGRYPKIDDNCTNDGVGSGSFETKLEGLEPFTIYHLRAYATNGIGTGYGEELIFITLWDNAMITDFDGNTYGTVQIGDQIWMTENVRSFHYADGTPIAHIESDEEWRSQSPDVKAYCYYENSPDAYDTYGALYTWAAAVNGEESSDEVPSGIQGVCPDGWHVPGESEWKQLEYELGMSEVIAQDEDWRGYEEGGMLKETGTVLWVEPNLMATNETGFTATPAGYRDVDGVFTAGGSFTAFWSSTSNEEGAWLRGLHAGRGEILHKRYQVKNGFSVRCVKDR